MATATWISSVPRTNDDTIAWYENVRYDFGDAPASYPTTLAEDGARHARTGPMLGATRDSEIDGIHSVDASADGTDDDGVTFGSVVVGVQGGSVTVEVTECTR